MISPSTAVEARTPVARRLNSVNCPRTSIARTTNIARKARRRRIRSRVRVVRETCETAGDMESNLAVPPVAEMPERGFPPSNWVPDGAVMGAVLAIVVGLILGLPAIAFTDAQGDLTAAGNIVAQVGLVLGLVLVPLFIARSHGAASLRSALQRLGFRRFEPSALIWMGVALLAY